MITVYGIKSCDSCRNALKWLGSQDIDHAFHDLRADGLGAEQLSAWLASPFGPQLVNRRSTTWRTLSDREKAASGEALLALLLAHPTLIKRPVICDGPAADAEVLALGFKAETLRGLVDRAAKAAPGTGA